MITQKKLHLRQSPTTPTATSPSPHRNRVFFYYPRCVYDASSPFLHSTPTARGPRKKYCLFLSFFLYGRTLTVAYDDDGSLKFARTWCGVASSFKLRRPRRTPLDLEKTNNVVVDRRGGWSRRALIKQGGWVVQFARGPKPGGRASALQFA